MQIARLKENSIDKFEVQDYKLMFPDTSFSVNGPTDEWLKENDCYKVSVGKQYDPLIQKLQECEPYLSNDLLVYTVKVVDLNEDELLEVSKQQSVVKDQKIDALWRATDAYITQYISGVAIGILTLGMAQMKPKAIQVSKWTQMIWGNYYQRKAAVTATSVDDHDYSAFGPIPFSIEELKEEAGL